MSLTITAELLDAIRRHAEATYPEECGGLLVGVADGPDRHIREIVSLENTRSDSRHNRVALDPLSCARIDREATRRGLGVWGFYHSHPDHPPVPSAFDLEQAAFPNWSYLIVEVRSGQSAEIRSWVLLEDRSQFQEEEVRLCPSS